MMNDENNYFDWILFRRDVRRDVRNCTLFLILFYGINLLVTGIIEGILIVRQAAGTLMTSGGSFTLDTILDFMNSDEGLANVLTDGSTIALVSIAGVALGSLAFVIYRGRRFFTVLALPMQEPLRPFTFILLAVVTQGIQFFTGAISTLVETLLPEGVSIIGNYEGIMDSFYTPVGFLYIILIGPIFEELIFRGAIMGSLRKYGDNFAIVFSALLFGLYHGVVLQIPFAFVMGLVLGYAAARWSLRTSIALHIISNGLSVLLAAEAFAVPGGLGLLFCGILTIVFLLVFRRQFAARVRLGAPYYGRVTYANGFSSIAFWLFAAGMLTFAISQLTGVVPTA